MKQSNHERHELKTWAILPGWAWCVTDNCWVKLEAIHAEACPA